MSFVKRSFLLGASALFAAFGVSAGASAHPGAAPDPREVELLGPQHAAEHAEQAALAEARAKLWKSMSPRERGAIRARVAATERRADAVPPEEGGLWSAPFPHRSFGMHAALLPTGKVLFYSLPLGPFGDQENKGLAWLWDPSKGTGAESMKDVDPPVVDVDGDGPLPALSAPIYCSGNSFLPDGRLLVTGGNRSWPLPGGTFVGWEAVFTFNPFTEKWAQQPSMSHGRWYPSQVLDGQGRTLIVGGYDERPLGGVRNPELERFTGDPDPDGTNGLLQNLGGARNFALYPHLFTMPSGQILVSGPGNTDSALINPDDGSIFDRFGVPDDGHPERALMSQSRIGGTAVLRPAGPNGSTRVTNIGGYESLDVVPPEGVPAVATSETIDLARAGGARYEADAPLNVARSYHNTVLLPDGGMVTVGGNRGRAPDGNARWPFQAGEGRPVELLAPGGTAWTLGAAQAEDRGYHSVALLLPDGRVLSAGDDREPSIWSDSIELYSPPYLFKGTRPDIDTAPAKVGYGQKLGIGSASPDLRRAVLMAPGAVTHSTDMTQRHVELEVVDTLPGQGLNVRAPANGNLAPPGHYMLFLLDAEGVPSEASWIEVGATAQPDSSLPTPDPPKDEPKQDEPKNEPPRDQTPPRQDPPPPAPPAPGPAPQDTTRPQDEPADRLAPVARLRVTAADVARLASTLRLRMRLSVDEPVTVTADLGLKSRWRALAHLRATKVKPGTRTLSLKVSRSVERRLRGRKATIRVVSRDAAGNRRTLRVTFSVPKRRR